MSKPQEKMSAAEYQQLYGKGAKPAKKKNKFGAVKKVVDDILFASTSESDRYGILKLRHKAGEITKPILQYEFLLPGGLVYTCDFFYFDYLVNKFVVEDHKGVRTEAYIMRKKLLFEKTGIIIFETSPPRSRRQRGIKK